MLPVNTPKSKSNTYEHIQNSNNKIKDGEEVCISAIEKSSNQQTINNHSSQQQKIQHNGKSTLKDRFKALKRKKDNIRRVLHYLAQKRIMRKCLAKSRKTNQQKCKGRNYQQQESEQFDENIDEAANQEGNDFTNGCKIQEEQYNDQDTSSNFTNHSKKYKKTNKFHVNAQYIFPALEGHKFHFTIVRKNQGMKMLYPQFQLKDQDNQAIIFCKKVSMFCFAFSLRYGEWQQNDQSFIGRLQSNLSGSILNFYLRIKSRDKEKITFRLACSVQYTNGFLEFKKPRTIKLFMLDLTRIELDEESNSSLKSLGQLYRQDPNNERVLFFQNRLPIYHKNDKIWSLDFHGRAPMSSIKNFILQNPKFKGREYLLLGKRDPSSFNLDFMHPFSFLSSFIAGVSAFNGKVICQ